MSDGKPMAPSKRSPPEKSGYAPSPRERAQATAYFDRQKRKPLAPRLTLKNKGNTTEVSTNYPLPTMGHTLLMQAIGVSIPSCSMR